MIFSSEDQNEEEPHTVSIKSLPGGKGKVETYYSGEAMPPGLPMKDISHLKLTKGKSIPEIHTWRAKIKRLVTKFIK